MSDDLLFIQDNKTNGDESAPADISIEDLLGDVVPVNGETPVDDDDVVVATSEDPLDLFDLMTTSSPIETTTNENVKENENQFNDLTFVPTVTDSSTTTNGDLAPTEAPDLLDFGSFQSPSPINNDNSTNNDDQDKPANESLLSMMRNGTENHGSSNEHQHHLSNEEKKETVIESNSDTIIPTTATNSLLSLQSTPNQQIESSLLPPSQSSLPPATIIQEDNQQEERDMKDDKETSTLLSMETTISSKAVTSTQSKPSNGMSEEMTIESPNGEQSDTDPQTNAKEPQVSTEMNATTADLPPPADEEENKVIEEQEKEEQGQKEQQQQQKEHLRRLEKELEEAKILIANLNKTKQKEDVTNKNMMMELQSKLNREMGKRAEAEDAARRAQEKTKSLDQELANVKTTTQNKIQTLSKIVTTLSETKSSMMKELEQIRVDRDEQARKQSSLTTRLNSILKEEGLKTHTTDYYDQQFDELQTQLEEVTKQLTITTVESDHHKKKMLGWKSAYEQKTKHLKALLENERMLNSERKQKMKGFVEAKTEEVRQAKADNISLQTELDQTTRSLKDLNQRYKQLHGQWVQSQTRNRELQRDLAKTKVESEKMSKAGGTLEAKLTKSAKEMENHKTKRLQAKNELMSVIAQLESEKDVNSRLRDYIKSTILPRAISQQQSMRENISDYQSSFEKMATRLGRELPPPSQRNTNSQEMMVTSSAENIQQTFLVSDINTARILSKVEEEMQRVTQHINDSNAIARQLNQMLDSPMTRGCVGALQDMFLASPHHVPSTSTSTAASRPRVYGKIPGTTS